MSARPPAGAPPLASDIAAGLSQLRSALSAGAAEPFADRAPMKRPKDKPWPRLPAQEALAAGLPFLELLRQGVYEALFRSLAEAIYLPLRAELGVSREPGSAGTGLPVGWYGQQDAAWIAHLDVLRRLGIVPGVRSPAFDAWVTLARSGGWWWPGEDRCVVVERPVVIRTAPLPGGLHDEVQLHRDHGKPAVEYRDGWSF